MTDERPTPRISCSFCRRDSAETTKMISARDGAICDECVGLCLGILAEDPEAFEATVEQARAFAASLGQADTSKPAL